MTLIKTILSAILYFIVGAVLCTIGLAVLAVLFVVLVPACLVTMLIVVPLYLAIDIGSPDDIAQWVDEIDKEEPEEHTGATIDDCR